MFNCSSTHPTVLLAKGKAYILCTSTKFSTTCDPRQSFSTTAANKQVTHPTLPFEVETRNVVRKPDDNSALHLSEETSVCFGIQESGHSSKWSSYQARILLLASSLDQAPSVST